MKLTYDYFYFARHTDFECPKWVRDEGYSLSNLLPFRFWKR